MPDKTPPVTLLDLLESGAPSHPALVAPGGPVLTYDSLRCQVRGLAEQLRAMGIARGDRVAIVLPNGIEAIVTFLAVAAAGTAAPLNPAYKAAEFEFYMDDTNAKALITRDDGGEEARSAAPASVLDIRSSLDEEGRVILKAPEAGGQASAEGLKPRPRSPTTWRSCCIPAGLPAAPSVCRWRTGTSPHPSRTSSRPTTSPTGTYPSA